MELQVLVATVGKPDASLIEKMNLRQDAIIADQWGCWRRDELETEGHRVQVLSSDTIGVGINRNLALQAAEADILLFADDDITYYDGDLQPVIDAFRELPDADVIFFAVDMTKNGEIFDRRRHKRKRLHLWNSLKYGACRMAVRRSAIIQKRLCFSTLFGGGCIYCSGEDTIFIRDCFRAGLRAYAHPYVLGACAKDCSSWFSGFHEKYFYDRGAMLACAFPRSKHLMKWYFAKKLVRKSGVVMRNIIRHMNAGIRGFQSLTPYESEQGGNDHGKA